MGDTGKTRSYLACVRDLFDDDDDDDRYALLPACPLVTGSGDPLRSSPGRALLDTRNTPLIVEQMPTKKGRLRTVSCSNSRYMMTPDVIAHVVNST